MEIALIAVKFLRFLGNFLFLLIRAFAGFFRFVFGELFFKILVKIYYSIFRLKKNDLANQTWSEFLKDKRLYWFILGVALAIFAGNLTSRSQTLSPEEKIPQTVMSHLVTTEFDSPAVEQLVQVTASPGAMGVAGQTSYNDNSCLLQKQSGLAANEPLNSDAWIFDDNGDLIYKPSLIYPTGQTGPTNNQAPTVRTGLIYYTVQDGDTISNVARRFGLTINTILWANSLSATGVIRPGDTLTILPYSGILYTVKSGDTLSEIAAQYGISSDNILSCNNLGAGLKIGQKIIVPGAKMIAQAEAATTPKIAKAQTGLSLISHLVQSSPSFTQSSPSQAASTGKMAWPTVGHIITQYFSWRHPAIDIANKIGTPVYAAADGVVIFAGWATGYGYSIVIDHGNGLKTRYGHSSKLYVSVGDHVTKGENIMAMGETGWATGPHVHFEVMINGAKVNPLNYVR